MPVPTFVNAGVKAEAASGNITLGAPASPLTNDVWIAAVHSSDSTPHTFTGWTQIVQSAELSGSTRLSVWWFRYAGSTPNLIVTHAAGISPVGGIAAFRGCKTSGSPVNVVGSLGAEVDATIELSAVITTVADCLLLAVDGSADDNNRSTLPTGFSAALSEAGPTNAYKTTLGTPDGSVALHYKGQALAGSSGAFMDTQLGGDAWTSVLLALAPATAAGVSMLAGSGAYGLTGQAATLRATRRVNALAGSYATTGQAAGLKFGRNVSADAGAYVMTGTAAGLRTTSRLAADVGGVLLTGTAAGLRTTSRLVADAGSYTWTGIAAGLKLGRSLAAPGGVYLLSGQAAGLELDRRVSLQAGAYLLTGTAAGLEMGRVITAAGIYLVTGQAAGLLASHRLAAAAGAYSWTGQTAGMTHEAAGDFVLEVDAGVYTLTGAPAGVRRLARAVAASGAYGLTGSAATLTYTSTNDITIMAASGAYVLTGSAAGVIRGGRIGAGVGVYQLTGSAAGLLELARLPADSGVYVLTGGQAGLREAHLLVTAGGVYLLMGGPATLEYSGTPAGDGGGMRQTSARMRRLQLLGVRDNGDAERADYDQSTRRPWWMHGHGGR